MPRQLPTIEWHDVTEELPDLDEAGTRLLFWIVTETGDYFETVKWKARWPIPSYWHIEEHPITHWAYADNLGPK